MAGLQDLVPYCPVCQVNFMLQDVEAFALMCNHIFCWPCLQKISSQDSQQQYYSRCYFDGGWTQSNSIRQLVNLKAHLTDVFAKVVTVRSGAARIDEELERAFNLRYDRRNIPCKFPDCHQAGCCYDHSGRFYKKTDCPFDSSCPNYSTCIFIHSRDRPAATVSLPATTLPTSKWSPPQQGSTGYMVQQGNGQAETYYSPDLWNTLQGSAMPERVPSLPAFISSQMPTYDMQTNSAQQSTSTLCPYCHCYQTVCSCWRSS